MNEKAITELKKMADCLNQGEKHYANAMALLKGKEPENKPEQETELEGVF